MDSLMVFFEILALFGGVYWALLSIYNWCVIAKIRDIFEARPELYADDPEARRRLMAAAQFQWAAFRVDE